MLESRLPPRREHPPRERSRRGCCAVGVVVNIPVPSLLLIGRFQGTRKGTVGSRDGPLGEKVVLGGTQMDVHFQPPGGQ